MILAYAIILLVIVALILRRDLSAIGRVSYRGGWKLVGLVVGLFVLQAVLIIYVPANTFLQIAILVLSQIALVFLVLLNHHVPGAKIFAVGIILNIAVMVANGGLMPITPERYQYVHPDRVVEAHTKPPSSKNIILPRDETRLWVLSDIIPVPVPWRRYAISIGDVLLMVGAAQFIFLTTGRQSQQNLVSAEDV